MPREIDLVPLESQLNHNYNDTSVCQAREMGALADTYAENAVDPQNFEPNLALDLEIADLINSKKANA